MDVADVVRAHTEALLRIDGVQGLGVGVKNGRPCVLVLVKEDNADVRGALPDELDGYPVAIRETGEFKAR